MTYLNRTCFGFQSFLNSSQTNNRKAGKQEFLQNLIVIYFYYEVFCRVDSEYTERNCTQDVTEISIFLHNCLYETLDEYI